MFVDLDDVASRDRGVVGAKAAGLARARAAGLPVLPGVVVPTEHAERALRIGTRKLAEGGSGAARLAVMELDLDAQLVAGLTRQARHFPAVVRSSSKLESGGVWAGAFSTFDQIGPDDLGTAIRGVWASVFSVAALERLQRDGRSPKDAGMAVLVQPHVNPDCGGTAFIASDGGVHIAVTSGPLNQLMAGWDAGATATVRPNGDIAGSAAVDEFGAEPLVAAATLAQDTFERVGDNLIEWAFVDARVVLLQSSRSESELSQPAVVRSAADHLSRRFALGAVRFPGPLGDRLVLPWLAASDIPLDKPVSAPSSDPVADLDTAMELSVELIDHAWLGENPEPVVRSLLGSEDGRAPQRLAELRQVDERTAARVVTLLDAVAAAMVDCGWFATARAVWRVEVDDLRALLRGEAAPGTPDRTGRAGTDRWEPYVFTTVAAAGSTVVGTAAAPGIGAGPVVVLEDPQDLPPLGSREVIVTTMPIPAYAPLLWGASGLVTTGGNPGAHLIEVARSLGVPAVVGTQLEQLEDSRRDFDVGGSVAAVDGHRGCVSFLS